jgi:hypothetical protein
MGADEFRANFEAGDIDAVLADFAPDHVTYHAGQAEPTSDPGFLRKLWPAARAVLGDEFHFTDRVEAQVHGGRYVLLPWTTLIDGIEAEGVDFVKEDDDGRVLEIRITMRPLQAIEAFSAAMTARLGEFSDTHPPPAGA